MRTPSLVSVFVTLAALPHAAFAQEPDAPKARTVGQAFKSFQVELALASAGPVLWNDTPDMRLEETSVFSYGGALDFVFGDELRDLHRFGLGVSYDLVAHSESRDLALITPYLVYEIGHPLALKVGLGWAIGNGTEGFASNYSGVSSEASLRWSFLKPERSSPVSVALGLTGRFVFATDDVDYSSAFVGAEIELRFHKRAGDR